jgi:hypothetical protein
MSQRPERRLKLRKTAARSARGGPRRLLAGPWSQWEFAVLGGLLALAAGQAHGEGQDPVLIAGLGGGTPAPGEAPQDELPRAFRLLLGAGEEARALAEMAMTLHRSLDLRLGDGTTGRELAPVQAVSGPMVDDGGALLISAVSGGGTGSDRDYAQSANSMLAASDSVLREIRRLFNDEFQSVTSRLEPGEQVPPDEAPPVQVAGGETDRSWMAALVGLGLGGGGGGGALGALVNAVTSYYTGTVIDGYVSGAKVFVDLNGNYSWDIGEPYAITGDNGSFTFAAGVDPTGYRIISEGGTDTDTLASIGMLVGATGTSHVTPLTTLLTYTDADTLSRAGLTVDDLKLDPVLALKSAVTAERGAQLLKTGQSLLTLLANTTALVGEIAGGTSAESLQAVFGQIKTAAQTQDINTLLTDSTAASTLISGTLSALDVDTSGFTTLINAVATSVASVNGVIMTMSTEQVKAGENLAYAAAGQSSLLAEVQATASAVMAGSSDAVTRLSALDASYSAASLQAVASVQAARLAFNRADASGLRTQSDTVYLEAPLGGAGLNSRINVLANDSTTQGALTLGGVLRLDAASRTGALAAGGSATQVVLDAGAAGTSGRYAGLKLLAINAAGETAEATITAYDGATRTATLDTALGITLDGSSSYLVGRALPAGLQAQVSGGQVLITGTPEDPVSQLDLLYLAGRRVTTTTTTGTGTSAVTTTTVGIDAAKAGLLTVYLQPSAPALSALGPTALVADEALTGAPGAVVWGPEGGVSSTWTKVNLGLQVGSLGTGGSLEVRGLPDGSVLTYQANGQTQYLQQSAGTRNWVMQGATALSADFSTLAVLMPGDVRGSFAPSVLATTRYGNLTGRSTISLTLRVDAQADGLVLQSGDAATLGSLFAQAVPDAVGEDMPMRLDATRVDALVNLLAARTVDANERPAVVLTLPTGWSASLPAGSSAIFLRGEEGGQPTLTVFAPTVGELKAALAALAFVPPAQAARIDQAFTLAVGTFEPSLVSASGAAAKGFRLLSASPLSASLDLQAVSDAPALTAALDNFRQVYDGTTVSVRVATSLVSPDNEGTPEALFLEVRASDLARMGAEFDASSLLGEPQLIDGWWRIQPGPGGFSLIVPDTVVTAQALAVRGVSIDTAVAGETITPALGTTTTLTLPFTQVPRQATLSVKSTTGYTEDQPVALDQLLDVVPGSAARSVADLSLQVQLPAGYAVLRDGVAFAPPLQGGWSVLSLAGGGLSRYALKAPANANGETPSLVFRVRDGVASQEAFSSTVSTKADLAPVADGLRAADFALTASGVQVDVGVPYSLHQPGGASLFAHVVPQVAGESRAVSLVFANATTDDVRVLVDGLAMQAEVRGTDLVFGISPEDLSSPISLVVLNNAMHGTRFQLLAQSVDGTALTRVLSESVLTASIDLTLGVSTPDVTLAGANGLEDQPVAVPLSVYVDPARASFERVGFKVAFTGQDSLVGSVLKVGDATFAFTRSGSQWVAEAFNANTQLDFTQLTFVAPSNYSGTAQLSFQPFARIGTSVRYGDAQDVPVVVRAVAEPVSLASDETPVLAGVEDQPIALNLAALFTQSALTDGDERVAVRITLPRDMVLYRGDTAIAPSSVTAAVDATPATATYLVTARETALATDLAGYRLVPTRDWASMAPTGDTITLQAFSYEPDGTTSTTSTLSARLVVTPVADTPGSAVVVKPSLVINESSAGATASTRLDELLRLPATRAADASERLYVELSAPGTDLAKLSFSGATVQYFGSKAVVAAEDFSKLVVAGVNQAKGSVVLSARVFARDGAEAGWSVADTYGASVSTTLTLRPVANGVSLAPVVQAGSTAEDSATGVTLGSFIHTAAKLVDTGETPVYKVVVPASVRLVATPGSLPVASAVTGGLEYVVAASDLSSIRVLPVSNYSGTVSLSFTAGSREPSNGATAFASSPQTVSYTVSPVSDAPTLVVPAAVAGLQGESGLAVPLQVLTNDSGELLGARIYVTLASGEALSTQQLANLNLSLTDAGGQAVRLAWTQDAGRACAVVDTSQVSLLPSLRVSSSDDYRGTGALSLRVVASSTDGDAMAATTTSTVGVSIYQPVQAPAFSLGTIPGDVGSALEIPFTLSLSNPPAGVTLSNVSVLLTGVPANAYLQVVKAGVAQSVGATLGSGVWLLSGSDLDGIDKLVLVDPDALDTASVSLSASAFITDPVSGASAQALDRTLDYTYDLEVGFNYSDPLVLSLDGSALSSQAVTDIGFDLDASLAGEERPASWVIGDAATQTGFAFLVRATGVAKIQANAAYQLTLEDLYVDFAAAGATNPALAADGRLTAAELSGAYLWFDNGDGTNVQAELLPLSALPGFYVSLPETVARPAVDGAVAPLYEAKAYWNDGADAGSMIAVAIPYQPAASAMPVGDAATGVFTRGPEALLLPVGDTSVTSGGERVVVPEDVPGGVRFTVALTTAQTSSPSARVAHLIKVYGVPEDAALSVGVQITTTSESFWLLTQDQTAGVIALRPRTGSDWLPGTRSDYGDLALSVQVVASTVVGGVVTRIERIDSGAPVAADIVRILGLPDVPVMSVTEDVQADGLSAREGGTLSLSALSDALSLSTTDTNESLFVRFHVDPAAVLSVAGATAVSGQTGWYQVARSALSGASIRFRDFYAEDTTLTVQGLSYQGGSYAVAGNTVRLGVAFTPVADGVEAFTVTSESTVATEGDDVATSLTLSARVRDPKELVTFELRVKLLADGAAGAVANDKLKSIEGATELDTDGDWRVFSIDATASGSTWSASGLDLVLDPYFDGQLVYNASAVSIDPSSGLRSTATTLGADRSLVVTPTVDATAAIASFLDAATGEELVELRFDEQGLSNAFRVSASSLDADETAQVAPRVDTSLFDLLVSTAADGSRSYQVQHKSGVPTPAAGVQAVQAIVTLTDGTASTSSDAASLSIALNKVATEPVLDSTGTVTASLRDGGLLSGLSLPRVLASSLGDGEVLFYRLSGVPQWLAPSAGLRVDESTWQFTEAELNALTWTGARLYGVTPQVVSMSWAAIQKEPSNGDSETSDPAPVSLTLLPQAGVPTLVGAATLAGREGQPTSLAGYSVSVPGFSTQDVASSVKVNVEVGAGLVVKVGGVTAPVVSAGIYRLTAGQLAQATVESVDPNFHATAAIRISAVQDISPDAVTVSRSVSLALANLPEDVVLAELPDATISEGATYALRDVVRVSGTDTDETVTYTLSMSSTLQLVRGTEVLARASDGTYRFTQAQLDAGTLAIRAPSSSGGTYAVTVSSRSAVTQTGVQGKASADDTFDLQVTPVLTTPTVTLSTTRLVMTEDRPASLTLVARPGAARDAMDITVELVDARGQLVTDGRLALSGNGLASLGGGRWRLQSTSGDVSLPLTATPAAQYANQNSDGTFEGLSLRVRTVASALGVSSTPDVRTAALEITAVTDGVTFNAPAAIDESGASAAAAGVSLRSLMTQPDTGERIESVRITGRPGLRVSWLENGTGAAREAVGTDVTLASAEVNSARVSGAAFVHGSLALQLAVISRDGAAAPVTQSYGTTLVVNPLASTPVVAGGTSALLTLLDEQGQPMVRPILNGDGGEGGNVEIGLRLAAFASADSKETLEVLLSGTTLVSGSAVRIGDRLYTSESDGAGGWQIRIPRGTASAAATEATLLLPKGAVYGERTLVAQAVTRDSTATTVTAADVEPLTVVSTMPPVAGTGFSATAEVLAGQGGQALVRLSDLVRIPFANDSQVVELLGLPAGVAVRIPTGSGGWTELPRMAVRTNDGAPLDLVRLSATLVAQAQMVLPAALAAGQGSLDFAARVGALDGLIDSPVPGDPLDGTARYGYSRMVEFSGALGPASDGNNLLFAGNAALAAGGGDDTVVVTSAAGGDVAGGEGRDTLVIGGTLLGGLIIDLGQQTIVARDASGAATRTLTDFETVFAGAGDDILSARDGSDITLRGGAGSDILIGASGNDTLEGGAGKDLLYGGSGRDRFVIAPGTGADVVEDFDPIRDEILVAGFSPEISSARIARLARDDGGAWYVQGSDGQRIALDLMPTEGLSAGDWVVSVPGADAHLVLAGSASRQAADILPSLSFDSAVDLATGEILRTEYTPLYPLADLVADHAARSDYFGGYDMGRLGDISLSYIDANLGTGFYKTTAGQAGAVALPSAHTLDGYVGLSGSAGDDVLFGAGERASLLYGGDGGNDILVGGSGRDFLVATHRTDGSTVDMEGNGGADTFAFVYHPPETVDGHLEAISRVRVLDFNRDEGDRILAMGFGDASGAITIGEVGADHSQKVTFSSSLEVVFDLSFVREVDSNFALRMSDFDRI